MPPRPTTIDSIHRYPPLPGCTGAEVARQYWTWLDGAWGALVDVEVTAAGVHIQLLGLRAIELSTTGAGDYAVRGGLLAKPGGRFRFSCTPEDAVAALLAFRPALPLWVYRLSHGLAHEWTMRRFGRHLARRHGPTQAGPA